MRLLHVIYLLYHDLTGKAIFYCDKLLAQCDVFQKTKKHCLRSAFLAEVKRFEHGPGPFRPRFPVFAGLVRQEFKSLSFSKKQKALPAQCFRLAEVKRFELLRAV